jgi:hypothetical protein
MVTADATANGVELAQNADLFEPLTLSVAKGEMKKDGVAGILRTAERA